MAISSAMAEVGRRCMGGRNMFLQAELERSLERLEDFTLRNSDTTPQELARFRRQQGSAGEPEAALCEGDALRMYERFEREGPDDLRELTDRHVARPGAPTWGDCL